MYICVCTVQTVDRRMLLLYEALSHYLRGLKLPQMLEAALISAKAKLEKHLTVVIDATTLKGKGRPG